MKLIEVKNLFNNYSSFQEDRLFGRWITLENIQPLLTSLTENFAVKKIGTSELNNPIHAISFGDGDKKILIWTQMHGNESTGTKAVFDFINYLKNSSTTAQYILEKCSFCIIPILNPDGALNYTRVNANKVDLNRDAVDRTQKESVLLRQVLEGFNPDFCFNMHDQRTIFGTEGSNLPATLSFLAPSEEESRKVTPGRIKTMNVISAMNKSLQELIPNQIGRYTDEFYPNATGDNFQKLGYSTILIESGHYKNDYQREEVRKFTMLSLLQGIYHIATSNEFLDYEDYFDIPNNVKNFFDVIHKYPSKEAIVYQFQETLENGQILFIPKKEEVKDINLYFYHKEIVFES